MKKVIVLLLLSIFISSCKKDKSAEPSLTPANTTTDPLALPWNTKNISFDSIQCSSHGYGYSVFYKDHLLWTNCETYAAKGITEKKIFNDSVMYLNEYSSQYEQSIMHYTSNGGYTWQHKGCGPTQYAKIEVINPQLIYSINSTLGDYISVTGIGKSKLVYYSYPKPVVKGTTYLIDTVPQFTHLDSVSLALNDSIKFVIKLK